MTRDPDPEPNDDTPMGSDSEESSAPNAKTASAKQPRRSKTATAKKPASKKHSAKKGTVKKRTVKKRTAKKRAVKKPSKRKAATSPADSEPVSLDDLFATAPGHSGAASKFDPKLAELAEDEVVLVAVRGMVLFPGVVLPVVAGRPRSVRAIQAAVQQNKQLGLLLQRDAEDSDPAPDDLYAVGTLADIVRYVTAPDGTHHVIVQGQERFRVKKFVRTEPFFVGKVERMVEPKVRQPKKIEARTLHLKHQASTALDLLPEPPEELAAAVQNADSPSALTDLIATFMELPAEEKQDLLETLPLLERMEKVSAKLTHLTEVLSLSKDLRQQTRGTMEKAQREYFLREQLKTIQAELGEGAAPELADLAERIDAAKLPEEAEKEVRKELARLERMPEQAAEYGMLRSYLELMVDLPWSQLSKDSIHLREAQRILDEDHFGLEKVKKRILEFLAVRKLKPDGKSPILCLVGPPGVGKTSLGRSIARAMGREFVRISLGGVHDESEIRGHRRTYVGAMPGNIVQGLRRAGVANPVFLLDEMDKLGQGFHGDPSSALLEVLDPAQNDSFRDHYLGVPFNLSRVMFLATANVLDQIPRPLRDRCEVIEIASYTEEEKLEIAKRYLVERQREENGLKPSQFKLEIAALREIIHSYTREAGVRELDRMVGSVARRVATWIASGERRKVTVRRSGLEEILGPPRYENESPQRTSVPGVATGLAWTPVGGDILFIEATRMPGKGRLLLTGQLGDVMKESAQAALSVVRSRAEQFGVDVSELESSDLHIHLPAGAIPKDGPSAGVALFSALISLLSGKPVRATVAMTGEISLRGLVLPVGGIKEKVLAAYRAGLKTVLLPKRNERDWAEVPADARKKLNVVFIERVEQVLEHVFEDGRSPRRTPKQQKKTGRKKKAARRGSSRAGTAKGGATNKRATKKKTAKRTSKRSNRAAASSSKAGRAGQRSRTGSRAAKPSGN